MRTVVMLALAVLTSSVRSADEKETWKPHSPKGAGFSVLFPSEPKTGSIANQKPPIYTAHIKRTTVDSISFNAVWSPRDQAFASREAARTFVRGAESEAVKASKGKLISSKEITHGELEGRESVIDVSEDNVVRQRVFAGGKFAYTLLVWGKDEKAVKSPEANKFFDSFKLIKEGGKTDRKK